MFRSKLSVTAALVCFALVGSLLAARHASADKTYRVTISEGQHADIVGPRGNTVVRYMFQRDTSTPELRFDTAKVYAHVMAPGGKDTLTKGAGGKFPHHRGIFIGWNKIDHGGKKHDLWHVRNTEQAHQEFLSTEADESGATITSKISWVGVDGNELIAEKRTYRVAASSDAYAVIDFVSELTATDGDLKLGGDPEHAGVQFRPSQQVAVNQSAKYTFHQDGIDPKKQRDLPWVACTFQFDDELWTVQHMSHPENPKDAIWSAYRDYGRFGPFAVIELGAGQTVKLRYRFRVTKGDAPSRASMADQFKQYSQH